jgi:hypothetical protein
MKKILLFIFVSIVVIIAAITILFLSGFHFAKIGYVTYSVSMEESKENGVFMEELYPSQNKLPDNTINIINVWAERPWSYIDYFQTIKTNEDDVMVIIKCDKSVYNEDNDFHNEKLSKAYTDYARVMYVNKGIAIYLSDSVYKNLDSIEIKFPNPKEKLLLRKKK